jgi:hypothetical protein
MLSPLAIARRLVVYPCEEFEIVNGHLRGRDAELMVQFPHRRSAHSLYRSIESDASLTGYAQRMRTACVCPHVGECDLLGCALLKKKAVLRVEEEDGKGTVEESSVDVLHEMAYIGSVMS